MTRLTAQDKLTRLHGCIGTMAADNGEAFLLLMDTADGPLNLEIPRELLSNLVAHVMQGSVTCRTKLANFPTLGEADPAAALPLPSAELQVNDEGNGDRQLVLRVGVLDMSVLLRSDMAANVGSWLK
jgi:hypothetical protein